MWRKEFRWLVKLSRWWTIPRNLVGNNWLWEMRKLRDPAVVCCCWKKKGDRRWIFVLFSFSFVLFFLMVRSIKWRLMRLFPPVSNGKQNTLDDDRNGRSHGVYDVDKEGTKLGCKTLYSRFRENKPTPASIDRVCGLMDVVFSSSACSPFCYF